MSGDLVNEPRRQIVHAEALGWLESHPAEANTSVVTSLPDVTEIAGGFDAWRAWFVDAARRVIRWTPVEVIFYQSDIRHEGVWVDKGFLVQRAAEEEGASLVWHKIVCRKPPGTIAQGRASYSHLLGFSRSKRAAPRRPGPDVLPDAGPMAWSRAMGEAACHVACRYLRDETATRVVVDPFCGHGAVLAVANAYGFEAIGVDASARQCRAARKLVLGDAGGDARRVIPEPVDTADSGR